LLLTSPYRSVRSDRAPNGLDRNRGRIEILEQISTDAILITVLLAKERKETPRVFVPPISFGDRHYPHETVRVTLRFLKHVLPNSPPN
jgi:hypothetical protein